MAKTSATSIEPLVRPPQGNFASMNSDPRHRVATPGVALRLSRSPIFTMQSRLMRSCRTRSDQVITTGSELQRLLWLRQDGSNGMPSY